MTSVTLDQTLDDLKAALAGGGRLYVGGCGGEPPGLYDALARRPDVVSGATIFGVWIPGVNRRDWTALGPDVRAESIFAAPDWRGGIEAGRFDFVPETYSQTWARYSKAGADAAVFRVSSPDRNGDVSLGPTADFALSVRSARFKIAVVDLQTPRNCNSPRLSLSEFDRVVESGDDPVAYDPGEADEAVRAIARRVADLVPEGGTVQTGLGKIGPEVLRALRDRKNLSVWSGMVTDPLIELLDRDVVNRVVTGAALGSTALPARLDGERRVRFAPVGETHDHENLKRIPRLVAVNSAIEVDLFGQANGEVLDGRQVSGGGGMVDFLRGARASEGGLPVLALTSTARRGTVGRIVPRLSGPVTVARSDVAVVVTEQGVADLRGLSVDRRAEALIKVAAPAFRPELEAAWLQLRRSL